MGEKIYGYIRVSTREQHEDRQRLALDEFGVSRDYMFMDKLSGKNFDRPAWKNLMSLLRPDDLLVVKSIDRLGRNYEEMIEQWRIITKTKQADIFVIDTPILDTRGKRDLMGTLVADLVLVVMSYFAQSERDVNHQRQAEGIAAATARGVKLGRPPKQPPAAFFQLCRQWEKGDLSARSAAGKLGVTCNTFLKWAKDQRSKKCLKMRSKMCPEKRSGKRLEKVQKTLNGVQKSTLF